MDTGQHYDYELNALLYEQLGVAAPDHFLEVGSGSHAAQTAAILTRTSELLSSMRPRCVMVIGDTNSTLGAALAAVKLRIPVVHIEAGLRAADRRMAEEANRRLVDAVAELLCTPSRTATERLQAEQADAAIAETGDVARDVLQRVLEDGLAQRGDIRIPTEPFIFATLHRAELTDNDVLLAGVMGALDSLPYPVLMATHPRTRLALQRLSLIGSTSVHIMPPVGYLQSVGLISAAAAVITDSGGVQREAYWLGVPCVTVRGETEWMETVAAGANVLVGPSEVATSLATITAGQVDRWQNSDGWDRNAYGHGDAARRVADALQEWLDT